MKHVIDLTRGTGKEHQPEIIFYNYHAAHQSHSNARKLVRSPLRHEGHFGLSIVNGSSGSSARIYVETVEHAKKLIEALQVAIAEGWLFTEEEIDKYSTRVTDTLYDLIEARKAKRRNQ